MGLDSMQGDMNHKENEKEMENVVEVEEDMDSEDWCFTCKDGGHLMLCDYKGCLKVYHKQCAWKKKKVKNAGGRWICSRHSCSVCASTPMFNCLCCPNGSLCRDCFSASEFFLLKGNDGLCKTCLKLILLAEENSEYGLQGEKIDFKDRNTFECLFKEYWDIIKEKEGLTLASVYSTYAELTKGENQKSSSESVNSSDNDESNDLETSYGAELQKRTEKRKGFQPLEFMGWGSKPLIELLRSIGKDTKEELCQYVVESIIIHYIKDKDLPKKKNMVSCDESLQSIFRKKSINIRKIYGLLEEHFAKNSMVTVSSASEDEFETKLEDKNRDTLVKWKKRKVNSDIISDGKKDPSSRNSCFASIVTENMKLVYLRRSLIEELLQEPDYSKSKILGSFVRVKNDPRDYPQRNNYQLSQVKDMKKILGTNGTVDEILLQVSYSTTTRDISISLLSDADFTQEECEELRQLVANGQLDKLTVVVLEEKARDLHEDITKHWIQKELVRLQNRVDYTNERGFRRELFEYLEQRELLKQPSEQERLLKQLPEVIPEDLEFGSPDSSLTDKQ